MGMIADLGNDVDDILLTYVETVFTAVADPLNILLRAIAVVALLFIAVNQIVQYKAINYSVYLHWGLRYALIYSFAIIWGNFEGIYTILFDIPSDYVALMTKAVAWAANTHNTEVLNPANVTDANSALDEFGHAIIWIAGDFIRDTSIFNIGKSVRNVFMGALIMIIGGIFVAAGAIIVLIGKIGFALSIGLAPLAIVMLMTPQTKQHFENWSRFAVGFALIPLLTGGLMSIVLFVASDALANSGAHSGDKMLYLSFLFIMIAALVLLIQLPTMASTLAAASVAAVGAGALFAASRMAMSSIAKTYKAGSFVKGGNDARKTARSAGASRTGSNRAGVRAMRQSSISRASRRDDRLAKKMPGDGRQNATRPRNSSASGGESSSSSSSDGHKDTAEQQNLNRK